MTDRISTQLMLASNPATSAHLLENLAEDQDEEVRRAVASNPNTPWQVLMQLAWEFPQAFLSNPVAPLQIVAHPEQITLDGQFWDHLLQEAIVPVVWWNWLRSHPASEVSQMVRLHVQYAGEAPHPFGIIGQEEANDLLTLVELLMLALSHGVSLPALTSDPPASQVLHTGEQIVEEHLHWLIRVADPQVGQVVAGNELTPEDVLLILARDKDAGVQEALAGNRQTPAQVLRRLVYESGNVRNALASNERAPKETIQMLAQDKEWSVRIRLAENPQTPVDVVRTLAQDENWVMREKVASHPQMPVEMLQTLAQDQQERVREKVAAHPQAPLKMLRTLARDSYARVRAAIAGHPQVPEEVLRVLARDKKWNVRAEVASHPQVPLEVLQMLARDKQWNVRERVASNPRTSREIVQGFVQDGDWRVREAVASHPQASAEVLQTLIQDNIWEVRWQATFFQKLLSELDEMLPEQGWREKLGPSFLNRQGNDRITDVPIEYQLARAAQQEIPDAVRRTILAILATDWDATRIRTAFTVSEAVLRAVTLSQADEATIWRTRRTNYQYLLAAFLPPIALQKLAAASSWEVRYLVALHEQTPWETRQCLSQDDNRYVRAMAKASLKQRFGQPGFNKEG